MLRLSMSVPRIPAQRRLALQPLAEARSTCLDRPPWSAIFTKAYALLAQETVELRRVYLHFPVPRLYEYPHSIAVIAVERSYHGESIIYPLYIRNPLILDLGTIGRAINDATTVDLDRVLEFRRMMRLGSLPGPLRRGLMRIGLNIGRYRADFFGTYGLTVVASERTEFLQLVTPVSNVLNYGPFASDGTLDARIMFDHRVVDGAVIARALTRLEEILNGPIAAELRSPELSSQRSKPLPS